MSEPLCVDCKHYKYDFDDGPTRLAILDSVVIPAKTHKCLRLVSTAEHRSRVTGEVTLYHVNTALDCEDERNAYSKVRCGPDGRYFAPRVEVAESVAES